jgi:hypothetical protein
MSKRLTLLCLLPSLVAGGGHTSGSSSSSSSEAGSAADTDPYQQGAACYGFGGGHGVWKCGTSAAWCTEIGGVARYVEDYRSRRSGACMCQTGCTDASSIVPGFSKPDGHDGKACYGDSSGGHDVKCGVSADDCATIGGTAYAVGYVSTRSGCCMCNENCDHDLETGTDCASSYYPLVSSPAPPPLPPSPPPSPSFPPVLGADADVFEVSIVMNMTGTLSAIEDDDGTYTTAANGIKNALTVPLAVHVDDIVVTFSEGSIIATIVVRVPDQASVDKVQAVIDTNMATAADAQSFLGSSARPCIEKYTTGRYAGYCRARAEVNSVTSAVVDNRPGGLGTGALIGIIVGGVVVVAVVGLVLAKFVFCKAKAPSKGVA